MSEFTEKKDELVRHARRQLKHGMSDVEVLSNLKFLGWDKRQSAIVLAEAKESLPAPIDPFPKGI